MGLLRSLRARLLIIGVVPVLVALFVTAALTVRSLSSFSNAQRDERRAQRVQEEKRIVTGFAQIYGRLLNQVYSGRKIGRAHV